MTQGNKMKGEWVLYLDQYGNKWFAKSVKDLREMLGGGRVTKMYADGKDGKTYHVGYVVGKLWCTPYVPYRVVA